MRGVTQSLARGADSAPAETPSPLCSVPGSVRRIVPGMHVRIIVPWVFAVGTNIAARPPHRSQRARFRHWAPTLGVGRQNVREARDGEYAAAGATG